MNRKFCVALGLVWSSLACGPWINSSVADPQLASETQTTHTIPTTDTGQTNANNTLQQQPSEDAQQPLEFSAWKLALEKTDIKVFTQYVPGSKLKAFRGEMLLENTNLTQIEAFLKDIENTPKWLDRCDEAILVEQLSEEAVVLYVSLKMPWPVKDRDVIGLSELRFSPDRKTMYTSITKINRNDHPPVKGRIRAEEMRSELSFTELEQGKIRVQMEGHAEPGGSIPSWLANLLVTESPYKSLMNLRNLIPQTTTDLAQK
jgi:hypothetical protein